MTTLKRKNECNGYPLRRCIVTKERVPVAQLIRIDYHRKTGEIRVDCQRRLDGRGTYVLREKDAIIQLFKRKLLNRILRVQISGDDHTRLEQEVLSCLESQI